MTETIEISGVDTQQFNYQRSILREAHKRHTRGGAAFLTGSEKDALRGILDILDSWSDERYNRTKSGSGTNRRQSEKI